jgi:hypothetical protein
MPTTRVLVAAVALGVLSVSAAHSAFVSGTFAGTAYGSRINALSPNPGNFDGQTVTGTFWLNTSSLPPPAGQDAESSFTIFGPSLMKLTFSVPGQETVVFDGSAGNNALYLKNDSGGQAVSFSPDFSFPYWFASLRLFGSLFDGVDPTTLRAGPVDLDASSASFFAGRSFGGSVDLTSVRFDAVSEVPEPQTPSLLMAGLGLLAWMQRRVARLHGQRR